MKIAFWSHGRNKVGVTTNMVCISAMTAMGQQGRTVLLENHYSIHGIGDMLIEKEQMGYLREHGEYYSKEGIEYVLKGIYSGKDSEKVVRSASVQLLLSSMFYLPQSQIVNKEVFDYEFNLVYQELFRALEKLSDYVFVDTEANQNLSTNIILSEADLVVVNLIQDEFYLEDFFQKYSAIKEKAFFLIGRYRPEAKWNVAKICNEFKITRERIGVIPYNIELEEAVQSGKILHFLSRNYYKPDNEGNEYLLRYAKRASQMIRKSAFRLSRSNQRYQEKVI